MTLDQDIWSFGEYNSNCDLEHNRLYAFFGLLDNVLTSADNNKIVIKRSGIWTCEGPEIYNGLFQDFGSVSGHIDLVLNDTTSRTAVVFSPIGETQIVGFGPNFLTGHVYTFFIKQDVIGGRKVKWPNLSSVLGVVDENPNAITVSMVLKLPNGKVFVKNNAYAENNNIGYYEFRLLDDNVECNKTASGVSGNVLGNDWGGNIIVTKINGSAEDVGVTVVGSSGGLFTINSDGSYTFATNGEFQNVTEESPVVTFVTYSAHNGVEELSATLSVTVVAVWNMLAEVNLMHWFHLNAPENYLLNLTTISQVNDLSGNGRHLTQATATGQPTLVSADLNGYDVASFDGGDTLNYETWFTEQNHCIFYVVKGNNTIAACGMTTGGTCLYSNNPGAISSASQGGKGEQIGLNGFAAYQYNPNVISNLLYRSQTLDGYNIIAYKWEARKPTGFLNGIPFEIGVTANQGTNFYLSLGAGAYGTFNGRVAERIITDGIPTQEIFAKIEGQLAHKYNLQNKLQFNHTYKDVIPGDTLFAVSPDFGYSATTDSRTGNVLLNDINAVSVTKVNGLSGNVGTAVAGSSGGLFTINADGSWTFTTNNDFDSLSGTQQADTYVNYTATDGFTEKSTTLTIRVLASYYSELDYDGGGWTLLTDDHIVGGVPTYSYDPVTREFSLYASTTGSSSVRHFGANVTLGLGRNFTQVRVFHSGGSGYSCAGVTWNNFIYGGNEDLGPLTPHSHYPGWYNVGCDLIKNRILVNGWNTRTMLYPGTRVSLGLAGYSGCTRVTMKNIVLVR